MYLVGFLDSNSKWELTSFCKITTLFLQFLFKLFKWNAAINKCECINKCTKWNWSEIHECKVVRQNMYFSEPFINKLIDGNNRLILYPIQLRIRTTDDQMAVLSTGVHWQVIPHLSLLCVIAALRKPHADISLSYLCYICALFQCNTWHCSEELDRIFVTMEAKLSMGHRAVGHVGAWHPTVHTLIPEHAYCTTRPARYSTNTPIGCSSEEEHNQW